MAVAQKSLAIDDADSIQIHAYLVRGVDPKSTIIKGMHSFIEDFIHVIYDRDGESKKNWKVFLRKLSGDGGIISQLTRGNNAEDIFAS